MNYIEGKNYMLELSKTNKFGTFSPYEGLTVNYPGRKKTGDYRLSLLNGNAPTHLYVVRLLYNLINYNTYTFNQLQLFLNDIYDNGTTTLYDNPQLESLKHLIFWITLQEEINYPREKGFAGINLPFCRFFESIYLSTHETELTIENMEERCNNHGRCRPNLIYIPNAPEFYRY